MAARDVSARPLLAPLPIEPRGLLGGKVSRLQKDALFEIEVSPLNGLTQQMLVDQPEVTKAAISETEKGAKLSIGLVEESALARVINLFTQKDVKVMNLNKREPTLEDVFVDLVGRSMAEEESNGSGE